MLKVAFWGRCTRISVNSLCKAEELISLTGQASKLQLAKHLQADKGSCPSWRWRNPHILCWSLASAGSKKSIPSGNPGVLLFVSTQRLLVGTAAYCRLRASARQLLPPACPFLTRGNSGKKPKECKTCGFRYRNCKRMWSHPACCTSQLSINESSLLKSLEMGWT